MTGTQHLTTAASLVEKQTNTKWNDPDNLTSATEGKRNTAAVVISKLCCLGSDFSERTGEEHVMKSRVPTFRSAVYSTGLYNHLNFQPSQPYLDLCLHI